MALSCIALAFEYQFGLRQCCWLWGESEEARSPLRPLLFGVTGVVSCFSIPTLLPACVYFICGWTNYCSIVHKEAFRTPLNGESYCLCHASTKTKYDDEPHGDTCDRISIWWRRQHDTGMIGEILFASLYIIANVLLWSVKLANWRGIVADSQKTCAIGQEYNCLSDYAPFAKAFGGTLNMNCSFILLPILKSFIRALNDSSIYTNKHFYTDYLPPLRKNLVLHKFIALMVFIGTVGHVFFHLMNLMKSPEGTIARFTWNPIVSGAFIALAMVIVFTGAQSRVKREQYEIFWVSHHFFVVFFVFLLAHAPRFWAWACLILVAYLLEIFYRKFSSSKIFFVSKVVYEKPVMRIHFFPKNRNSFSFLEGQYLYLLVPTISESQWHPFTISSASEDLKRTNGVMTLHIRVQDEGSWTYRVCEMFRALARSEFKQGQDFSVSLDHFDSNGVHQLGKYKSVSGVPLIKIDGPHAAPAQHYSSYEQILLVGAGIGLTPSAAILKSILLHKWSKNFLPHDITYCWVVRHSEIKSFRWFIKLLLSLETRVAHDYKVGNVDATLNKLKIHIFVTGTPGRAPSAHRPPSLRLDPGTINDDDQPTLDISPLPFNRFDLENAMLNPIAPVTQLALDSCKTNRFNNIRIWNGRPPWEPVFDQLLKDGKLRSTSEAALHRIGVLFCGASVIGKDLKRFSNQFSSLEESVTFDLHKENF